VGQPEKVWAGHAQQLRLQDHSAHMSCGKAADWRAVREFWSCIQDVTLDDVLPNNAFVQSVRLLTQTSKFLHAVVSATASSAVGCRCSIRPLHPIKVPKAWCNRSTVHPFTVQAQDWCMRRLCRATRGMAPASILHCSMEALQSNCLTSSLVRRVTAGTSLLMLSGNRAL
jgi:hypothetical protein